MGYLDGLDVGFCIYEALPAVLYFPTRFGIPFRFALVLFVFRYCIYGVALLRE